MALSRPLRALMLGTAFSVLCPVLPHVLRHALEQFLAVFCRFHIDEIDNNDASHIA